MSYMWVGGEKIWLVCTVQAESKNWHLAHVRHFISDTLGYREVGDFKAKYQVIPLQATL